MSEALPKSWEIGTGGMFYYGVPIQVRGIFTMRDKVSREDLQKAVDTAQRSYPYFCIRPVRRDGRFVQEYNDQPFVVLEREDPISPGTPEANGHLHTFGCWEDKIYADFFHGIGDGRGTVPTLVQSVLYYYCLYHYGEPMEPNGTWLADRVPNPEEYADPFLYAKKPEEKPLTFRRVKESFSFPELPLASDAPQTVWTINVDKNEFMRFTKAVDGSPAVITALFLSRAIDSVHPLREQPIVINMPVDIRGALGCEMTCQNCIDFLQLIYSEKLKAMPLDRQCTAFRGQVFLQSDRDYLNQRFYDYAQAYKTVQAAPTVAEKSAAIASILPVVPGACVSYMGQLPMGDIDRYKRSFRGCFDATAFGIVVEVFSSGDTISICLMNGLSTEAYYKAFLNELDQAGVAYALEKPYVNPPRKRFW